MDYRLSLTERGFLALYVSTSDGKYTLVSIYPNADSIGWNDSSVEGDSFVINLSERKPSDRDL